MREPVDLQPAPASLPRRSLPVSLLVLLAVILTGFLLLVVVHVTFSNWISDLDAKTDNETTRLAIGDAIVQRIAQVETGVYKLSIMQNERGRTIQQTRLHTELDELMQMLNVLQQGGSIEQVTRLNMANREQMVRTLRYQADEGQSRIVLEVIDLAPKLEQVRKKIDRLTAMLSAREVLFETGTPEQMKRSVDRVLRFIKTLPPLFVRMKENAGRMYYESSNALDALEQSIAAQKARLLHIEVGLITVIILSVMAFGFKVSRQIHDSNRRLQQATEDMAAAMAAAQQASQAKSAFLATMSHEIRTPMNGVIGMTELLQEDPTLNAAQRHHVEVIRDSSEALLSIINDILDFSKLEAGRVALEENELDLHAVVEGVIEILAPRARAAGLEIAVLMPAELEGVYRGDAGRLRQVLMNLMGNATKFTEQGSVRLQVSGRPANEKDGRLRFAVIDTGIGIDAGDQEQLFQSFSQVDASTSRKYGGSGLGLAISKRLVEAMGGEIGVQSTPGVGSTFWFELPLERIGPAANAMNEDDRRAIAATPMLLVDAEPVSREVLAMMLERWQVRYDVLQDAEGALACLRARGNDYGLVLCAQELPGLSGAEFIARLRRDAVLRSMPVVLISSRPHAIVCEETGEPVDAVFVTKPVKRDLLFEALVNALDLRDRQPTRAPSPATDAETAADALRDASPPTATDTDKRHRVLVAEDNEINQMVVTRLLERMGCDTDVAGNGLQAVEAASRVAYDLVLMDVQMPEMNGLDATRAIRAQEDRRQHLPIVAVTANAIKGDEEVCLAAGMDDYLSKPIKRDELALVLERYVGAKDDG